MRRPTHAWFHCVPRYVSRRSACASNWRMVRSSYFFFRAETAPQVPECSPPRRMGNFPARITAFIRFSSSFSMAIGPVVSIGISVDTKMPARYGSILFSSSNSSMWPDASMIAPGPLRVPVTYVVVRSIGNGITTNDELFHVAYLSGIPPKLTEYGFTGTLLHIVPFRRADFTLTAMRYTTA